ncbi:MAG TPA: ABC transporter permease [Thermomicrobiales bacterium]|jgi:osmoprotectant transport system permease protein|nr:ABC transporter permease [Thermomicrobiales bacterium]
MSGLSLDYLFENPGRVLELTLEHLQLSVYALLLGLVIAIPLGVLGARFPALGLPILSVLGAIYTIPSLAFLAILIPVVGLGTNNAVIVLAAYSLTFLVRNIITGLRGVDPAVIEAARGMGLSGAQVFTRVTLPLALPVIVAGVRTATVVTISTATVAGWVAAGGLGRLLFDGVKLRRPEQILAGAIAITLLAILADLLIRWLSRYLAANRARRAATGRT